MTFDNRIRLRAPGVLEYSWPPLVSRQLRLWRARAAGLAQRQSLGFGAGESPLGCYGLSSGWAVLCRARGFPGDEAGAPLKHDKGAGYGPWSREFPRRRSRGSIEARRSFSRCSRARTFPRRRSRGSIEARRSRHPDEPVQPRFPGDEAGAPLKRRSPRPGPSGERTFPRRRSRGSIEARRRRSGRRRMPRFPRRRSRGSIEAVPKRSISRQHPRVSPATKPGLH